MVRKVAMLLALGATVEWALAAGQASLQRGTDPDAMARLERLGKIAGEQDQRREEPLTRAQ